MKAKPRRKVNPDVTSRQSLRASVACLPFVVFRFLNKTGDQFSWGGSISGSS